MNETWQTVPLGSVLTERRETPEENLLADGSIRVVAKVDFDKGNIHLRTGGDTKTSMILVRPGDLLVSGINAAKGAVSLYSQDYSEPIAATIHYGAYIPNNERVDAKFLWWLMRSRTFRELLMIHVPGGIKSELKAKRLLPIPVSLPPLPEQRRIVVRIEKLAAKIEEARGLRRQAVEEAAVFTEAAVGVMFTQQKETHKYSLKSLAAKIGSGSTPSGGRAAYPSSGIPFIRSMNVRMRRFQWDDIAYIDEHTHHGMRGTQVQPHDVLLNITGASIGRVTCAPANLMTANVNQHVAIIRPKDDLNAEYLMYWLSQPSVQDLIDDQQKGATRQGLTKAQIEQFQVPLPPLAEQQCLVQHLNKLQAKTDALKALQAETAAELEALLPSVLDRAFSGRL